MEQCVGNFRKVNSRFDAGQGGLAPSRCADSFGLHPEGGIETDRNYESCGHPVTWVVFFDENLT